jgi:hypothetical protein
MQAIDGVRYHSTSETLHPSIQSAPNPLSLSDGIPDKALRRSHNFLHCAVLSRDQIVYEPGSVGDHSLRSIPHIGYQAFNRIPPPRDQSVYNASSA